MNKKKVGVIMAVIVVMATAMGGCTGESSADKVYVESVASLVSGNSGVQNRYSGVVEPQEVWEVNKNVEKSVKEIFVAEGDEVDRSKWLTGTSILTVADKFDRMTAMSLSRKPNSEISAIRYLIDHPESYPQNVVSALAKCIHIMPVGCCVDLTNGDKGLVLETNERDFNHPVVLCFRDNRILDLSSPKVNKTIQIADVMHTMDNRVKMDA